MRTWHFSPTKRQWDRAFLLAVAAAVPATAIGVFFGGPLDNFIVVGWMLPLWFVARTRALSTP
jgi:hypothetical protein